MSEDFEIVRGNGNIFRDLDLPNADLEQLRALLAAQILKTLDGAQLSEQQAEEATGIAAADFARIRRVKLGRFTIDRLMTVLDRLGQHVDVAIEVHPQKAKLARTTSADSAHL